MNPFHVYRETVKGCLVAFHGKTPGQAEVLVAQLPANSELDLHEEPYLAAWDLANAGELTIDRYLQDRPAAIKIRKDLIDA